MKKSVMPKQAAPVERLNSATAGAAGAEKGVVPLFYEKVKVGEATYVTGPPFAGDDAE